MRSQRTGNSAVKLHNINVGKKSVIHDGRSLNYTDGVIDWCSYDGVYVCMSPHAVYDRGATLVMGTCLVLESDHDGVQQMDQELGRRQEEGDNENEQIGNYLFDHGPPFVGQVLPNNIIRGWRKPNFPIVRFHL